MNWANFKIDQYINDYGDMLVEFSRSLVDNTRIYKEKGLSISQIHNLVQEALKAKSVDKLEHFICEETERANEGKGWKYNENGQFFADVLKEYLNELILSAKAISSDVGYEYEKEIYLALVRKFLIYMAWYINSRHAEEKEKRRITNNV